MCCTVRGPLALCVGWVTAGRCSALQRGASIGPTPKYLAKLYAPSSDGSECRIHFFKNPSDPEPRVVCTVARGAEFDIQRKKCAVRITVPSHWYECGFSSEQVMVSWVGKIKELQPGLVLKGDTVVLESMIYDCEGVGGAAEGGWGGWGSRGRLYGLCYSACVCCL